MSQPRLIVANDRNRVMTSLNIAQAVEIVRSNPSSRFAADLVRDYDRYRSKLSGNKAAWLLVIGQQVLDRRNQPEPARTALGGFEAIKALFDLAGSRLKFPKIRLETADGRPVVLAVAGDRSKYAGQINVSSGHKYGDDNGRFYGRIAQDGTTGVSDEGVLELLRQFAADPQGVAAEYGRRTGQCCFCKMGLTDERSLAVGYGPVCADNYNLPWGIRPPKGERQGELPLSEEEMDAEFAIAEREQEERGFASDPDFAAFRASGGPSRAFSLEDLLEAAAASAGRDGYFPPARERVLAGAGSAPWRDDD